MMPVNLLMMEELAEIERQQNLRDFYIQRRLMRNNSSPFELEDTLYQYVSFVKGTCAFFN